MYGIAYHLHRKRRGTYTANQAFQKAQNIRYFTEAVRIFAKTVVQEAAALAISFLWESFSLFP